MKVGFLFSGQGSQFVGMGKELYENYDEAKTIYDKVLEITDVDIAKLSFEGREEELNRTKYTQLAVLTNSLAILEVLKKNKIFANISAGLSLGEYSALIYSGALSFEDGVKTIQKRGEYMEELLPEGEWLMAAILGLDDNKVEDICKEINSGFVTPANYNCNGQVVISGEKEGVEKAAEKAKEAGAKVSLLNTAGPFHTKKLIKAKEALEEWLKGIEFNKFNTKVIKNIDGDFYTEEDNKVEILANHIVSPVRFTKTLDAMLDEGIDTFIEVGPSRTLSSLIKRTAKNRDLKVEILTTNNIDSLEKTINYIKERENNE